MASASGTDSEVVARARRRQFSNADKRRILEAADRCTKPGEIGALMRHEGVYSSSLSTWRRQREAAELAALAPQKRGPKFDETRAEARHIAQLTRERDNLRRRLDKALLVIDVQKTCSLAGQSDRRRHRQAVMAAVQELTPALGASAACHALGVPRGTPARQRAHLRRMAFIGPLPRSTARPRPPLALDALENQVLLDTLNSERFADTAPAALHATLLDEGRYLGSVRTMYRLLAANGGSRERRNQLVHPAYTRPELLARAPNQVWSWDITKLKGPARWTCFHLYVILDIFSRHVVGWLIAGRESAELAEQLIADSVARHDIAPGVLTLHADRGASMRSKPVAALLVDLDITKSHSRPHVSDDNPFSESQFKTMKYRPDFPARFGCIEDARAHCQAFFAWYNTVHRHSGIGFMTPHSVHYGLAQELHLTRQAALDTAFRASPNRFKGRRPEPPRLPTAVWINPPPSEAITPNTPQSGTVNS
ncbi:IS3 family transposase [Cupriavidus sp. D39]|uniref:IS3 family transposase n=1 Tax=Cupriavidus sp. D39 TaxID=2997877 RepID=UPI003B6404AC